jgi:hypothetical protein
VRLSQYGNGQCPIRTGIRPFNPETAQSRVVPSAPQGQEITTMAKKQTAQGETTSPANTNAGAPEQAISSATQLKYQDFVTTLGAVGVPNGWEVPKPLAYLIMNGFNQSMTDAAAFTKDQKAEALAEAQKVDPEATADDVNAKMALEAREKRFAAILAGTVGFRSGGGGARLPQLEKVMRDIAHEAIKAAVAAKGVAMPKGDKLKAFVDGYLAKYGDKTKVEAQARIDSAKADAGSLDDLLGDLSA